MKYFITLLLIILVILIGYSFLDIQKSPQIKQVNFDQLKSIVIPDDGFKSKIDLKNSIESMINKGILNEAKIKKIYSNNSENLALFGNIFSGSDDHQMILTEQNAGLYLNLLWAVGLSNKMKINSNSPLYKEKNIDSFASTGGWSLGNTDSGGQYFNKYKIVKLSTDQEKLVYKLSTNIYRPCCNNNTFFQDCNHGSAMLGLIELGASQGLTEDEIYREALAFNSYWFPNEYLTLALYFRKTYQTSWQNIDPKIILSKNYSSSSGWKNIDHQLSKFGFPKPSLKNPSGC